MKPHQERVVTERDELSGRLAKLVAFFKQVRLKFQACAMGMYLAALDDRIRHFV